MRVLLAALNVRGPNPRELGTKVRRRIKTAMEFALPDEARNHFDKQADSLVAALKPLPPRGPSSPRRGSDAHIPVAATLTEADLRGRMQVSSVDWQGQLKAIEVHGEVSRQGQEVHEGLPAEDAERLVRVADAVARSRALGGKCGPAFVQEHLIDWINRRRLREGADGSWTTEFLAALKDAVHEQIILVPLDGIAIASPFKLGPVSFDYFTESVIDSMVPPEAAQEASPENVDRFRTNLKERYQGHVYAHFECVGEKEHAADLAVENTDAVLEILRMFDAAAFHIDARCQFGRTGQIVPSERHVLRAGPPERLWLSHGVETKGVVRFGVSKWLLGEIQRSGFGLAAGLLEKEQRTDLEKRVLESISHFAHGVASPAPQDRIVHALVAVEALLLRDENEPIQAKLGQRLAMLTATDLISRKAAVKRLQAGYRLRSAFVHHGVKPDDVIEAHEVLLLCWTALDTVAVNTQRFNSKGALLDHIDDLLLS